MGSKESKREQFRQAAMLLEREKAQLMAQAQEVKPRGVRFVEGLMNARAGTSRWREDVEKTLALAEKFELIEEAAALREHLAELTGYEQRFDRLYCRVLGADVQKNSTFVDSCKKAAEQLEKDYDELVAEEKAAAQADAAAQAAKAKAAEPEPAADASPTEADSKPSGLILLSGGK